MLRRCRYALLLAVAIASTGIPSALSAGLTASSLNNATAHAPDMVGEGTHPVRFKNGANDNGSSYAR